MANIFYHHLLGDETVGSYAVKRLDFMEENHIDLVEEMNASNTLISVAHSVDDTA